MGFSQGAIAATLLLSQQQLGLLPWFPAMQFAVLVCCDFTDEASGLMHAEAQKHGQERAVLSVPTLHLQGRQDPCLTRSRRMVESRFGARTEVIEFEGGHQCPKDRADCEEAKVCILRLSDCKIAAVVSPAESKEKTEYVRVAETAVDDAKMVV